MARKLNTFALHWGFIFAFVLKGQKMTLHIVDLQYCDQLRIADTNCQSIRPCGQSVIFDEFKNIMIGIIDLIAISEIWLKPNNIFPKLLLINYAFS